MKKLLLGIPALVGGALIGVAPLSAGATGWEKITAPTEFSDGVDTWYPSCSDGSAFDFYIREPDHAGAHSPQKLLVYLTQGGACWNFATCVGSVLAGADVYFPSIPSNFDPTGPAPDATFSSGILDNSNPENPYGDYVQVVLPYCTGDVHLGHSDCTYADPVVDELGHVVDAVPRLPPDCTAPSGDPMFPAPFSVRHHGYDNVKYVAAELASRYGPGAVDTIVVAGSSAGGYGVLAAYPLLRELWPAAKGRMVSDGAMGILGDPLYQVAIVGADPDQLAGTWGVGRTLPEFLKPAFQRGVDALPVAAYTALASHYRPRSRRDDSNRFASYTAAFDLVQALFLNISSRPDDPAAWMDPANLLTSLTQFALRARIALNLINLLPNYAYYLGAGGIHAVLTDPDDPRIPVTRNLYDEASAGTPLAEWLANMENGGPWSSVSCAPNCTDGTVLEGLEALESTASSSP